MARDSTQMSTTMTNSALIAAVQLLNLTKRKNWFVCLKSCWSWRKSLKTPRLCLQLRLISTWWMRSKWLTGIARDGSQVPSLSKPWASSAAFHTKTTCTYLSADMIPTLTVGFFTQTSARLLPLRILFHSKFWQKDQPIISKTASTG